MKPGEFRVSPQIVGYWSSQLTYDGVLEALTFDSSQLTWSVRHSTWNRGPAADKSGLWIHLVWRNNDGAVHLLNVSEVKGRIAVDCIGGCQTRTSPGLDCSFGSPVGSFQRTWL